MEAYGARVFVAPDETVLALGFILAGTAFGGVSGLVPGLHVNNVALLLASVAPAVPGPPELVGAAILSAGVVHTFLDIVPALALGVPDAAMAMTALPGHRLVIAGRGREAVRLSALGSGLAVLFALPLALPLTHAMTTVYPLARDHLPLVLGFVVCFLLVTERTWFARVGGALAFLASTALGLVVLDLSPEAPLAAGEVLTPLFAGLFGAPVLLDALRGAGVPDQDDARIAITRTTVLATALAGTVAGAVVGYLPGVSSAIAAVLVLTLLPGRSNARGFVVATSGVNTANAIFALFALVSIRAPRTGVMVALDEAEAPLNLPLLLASAVIAGIVGFVLVLLVGDRYLQVVGRLDYTRVCVGVLALLLVLAYLFASLVGVGIFAASAAIGVLPVRFGARRVHLMGVLLGPLIVA